MKTTTNLPPAEQAMDITRRLLEQITLHPKDIQISNSPLGRLHTIKIQVNKGDMKRVVGQGGSHARAITTLIELIGRAHGAQIKSRIIEPVKGTDDRHSAFTPREEWNREPVRQVIQDIADTVFEFESKTEVADGEDFLSVIEVYVSPRERTQMVAMVTELLKPLVVAIGKANGRHLSLNIAPDDRMF